MAKAVLFDLDGVLIDSAPIVDVARREALASFGINVDAIPDPHGQGHSGSSTKNIIEQVKQHSSVTIDEEKYSQKFTEVVANDLSKNNIAVDPALIKLLQDLNERHVVCAIVTSSRAGSLAAKMTVLQIQNYFNIMVTADDVDTHKPAPDIYVYTMKKLGFMPAECVVVEDSNAGIEAGNAAGCKVIAFTKYRAEKTIASTTFRNINDWREISAEDLVRA